MKKYNSPKTRRIPLDTDQAILQVCMIGGAYLQTRTSPTGCQALGNDVTWCTQTPKGSATSRGVTSNGEEKSSAAS